MSDAIAFLTQFGALFESTEVQQWTWGEGDDLHGKRVSWPVGDGEVVEAVASVELMATQLQLTVTERDLSNPEMGSDVSFDALVNFDEKIVTLNGEPMPYEAASVQQVIERFNEVA